VSSTGCQESTHAPAPSLLEDGRFRANQNRARRRRCPCCCWWSGHTPVLGDSFKKICLIRSTYTRILPPVRQGSGFTSEFRASFRASQICQKPPVRVVTWRSDEQAKNSKSHCLLEENNFLLNFIGTICLISRDTVGANWQSHEQCLLNIRRIYKSHPPESDV
jgi:hypothetical protein